MNERIKKLEHQLADKEQTEKNTTTRPLPSKNLEAVPSSGRDDTIANSVNNPIPNEVEDILQIINTTMATLKSFENRYRNARST